MVRVISVHHFSKQHIQTIEQPTASAVAPPNRLLLSLSNHCIEVRDLNSDAELLFTFPTVDEVKQLFHCINGNYILTLEHKCNRQNFETLYVRIYANWDNVATLQQSKMTNSGVSLGVSECGMVQPMRARIAGRVTPTSNQSEISSLEMIELPVKRKPELVNCCQVSGNILILSSKNLVIYKFCIRTHDISKLRFIDFEELSLLLELSFRPTNISICENYIACMKNDSFHFFTISQISTNESTEKKTKPNTPYYLKNNDEPLDYKKMLKEEETYNCNSITVNLPSVIKENSAIHKHCPFTCCDSEMIVNIKSSSPIENWSQTYQVNNLLQLKLKPMVIEGAHRQMSEEFKCVVLKPLYVPNIHKSKKSEHKKSLLKSNYNYCLNSVACMLTTQQEGYLYIFCDNSDPLSQIDNCIAVYPFTAPVYKIVLEDYVLHALTETGLESYTLRIGHQFIRNVQKINNINVACPPVKDSVCLIGLRPFIGVEQLLLSENFLVLLANSENSPTHSNDSNNSAVTNWTLYNLELPSSLVLYNDFLTLANMHQFSSPQTYCHLISEAHMVLRITLQLFKWKNKYENAITLITSHKIEDEKLLESYRDSCKFLGDYFVMCTEEENYSLCLPYYKMSQITPLEVLKRVQEIQTASNNQNMIGLLYYLKTVLLQIKTWSEADVLFTLLGEQNFVDTVLDLFSKFDQKNLSTLVLKNNVLREYATDKLIHIFIVKNLRENSDLVALSVLYLQRYKQKEAQTILDSISNDILYEILQNNWELLFDTTTTSKAIDNETTFSELTAILLNLKPELLARLFAYLVTDMRAISLEKFLKIFLKFLPSHVSNEGKNGSLVIQLSLERFFNNYYSIPANVYKRTNYDKATFEALKILIRTYLSQLQIWHKSKDTKHNKNKSVLMNLPINEEESKSDMDDTEVDSDKCDKLIENTNCDYLFSKIRMPYLDLIPTIENDQETLTSHYETDLVLKKLQALLCSQLVPKQIINEMLTFFKLNISFKGDISLQSIVLPPTEATEFLLKKYPQCLLQFGKDRYTKDEEWSFLMFNLQQKILHMNKIESPHVYSFHVNLFKDILFYLATTIALQRFLFILPYNFEIQEEIEKNENNSKTKIEPVNDSTSENNYSSDSDEDSWKNIEDETTFTVDMYEPFIVLCKQTIRANCMKRLIIGTGQKLLTTLKL